MSCIRDNKKCTKCCEVLHIHDSEFNKARKAWKGITGDPKWILDNLLPLKKRVAKKRNPHMFKTLPRGSGVSFWKCKNLSKDGCSIYDERPTMCSGYPWYGSEPLDVLKNPSTYSPNCTVYYEIPIKVVY
jgi:Fe-S-cluster containining protein